MLLVIARVVVLLLGLALVIATLFSAIRSFVLPRSANDRMARILFLSLRFIFHKLMRPMRAYTQRDALLAYYAPIGLLLLEVFWLTLVLIGFMGMFWAVDQVSWQEAFRVSGSSLFTLGFAVPNSPISDFMTFSEALIGLVLIAILIGYLPTMYSAFSRREATVTLLEVRAGSPPSAIEMFERFRRLHRLEELNEIWATWEAWFSELEESHTSLAALAFFRSPRPHRHWVTAAGAVLDAASLAASTLEVPRDSHADLCIRAGYLALRHIADYFKIPYDQAPRATDPISISRAEFDEACRRLAAADVPLKPDLDQAWRDFSGWRVNYDRVLIALASLTMAPEAPWSSDRLTKRLP